MKDRATVVEDIPPLMQNLREAAAESFHLGISALASQPSEAIQDEIAQLIHWAKSRGFTERDMVVGLLRPVIGPVVSKDSHCRCPSCRERCAVCGSTDF